MAVVDGGSDQLNSENFLWGLYCESVREVFMIFVL